MGSVGAKEILIGSLAVIAGLAIASALFGPTGFLKSFAGSKAAARL